MWKDGEVPELKTVMAAMKPEQLPIDVILKNSHQRQQQLPHPHNSPCAHSKTNAYQGANHSDALHSGAIDSAGEYNVLELDGSRPARLMSELELDEVLRQLRQYAGMYQDMMHNYQAIFKRLKEEDAHKGGNAALKKPYLTGNTSHF